MLVRIILFTFWIVGAVHITACQTTSTPKIVPIDEVLSRKSTVEIEYVTGENGLIYLPIQLENQSGWFVLDTGATRSAVFKDLNFDLDLSEFQKGEANVFGLIETGTYPLIGDIDFRLSQQSLKNVSFAVLPKRGPPSKGAKIQADGVLGMDFLQNYQLFADTKNQRLFLLKAGSSEPDIVNSWIAIDLFMNPFTDKEKRLRFFNLRVGNHLLPALLDTGSEYNLINWNATVIPELKRMKRRLRQNWELQGAVGKFSPQALVNVQQLKAGRVKWEQQEFFVLDFQHLNTMGFADRALVIAGYPLLADQDFYMDFNRNRIWIEPEPQTD